MLYIDACVCRSVCLGVCFCECGGGGGAGQVAVHRFLCLLTSFLWDQIDMPRVPRRSFSQTHNLGITGLYMARIIIGLAPLYGNSVLSTFCPTKAK